MRIVTLVLCAVVMGAVQENQARSIVAATAHVGTAFGWRDVGQIRAGYNADLLVLDADPTADISNAKRIDRLMVAGTLIDRAALLRAGK